MIWILIAAAIALPFVMVFSFTRLFHLSKKKQCWFWVAYALFQTVSVILRAVEHDFGSGFWMELVGVALASSLAGMLYREASVKEKR